MKDSWMLFRKIGIFDSFVSDVESLRDSQQVQMQMQALHNSFFRQTTSQVQPDTTLQAYAQMQDARSEYSEQKRLATIEYKQQEIKQLTEANSELRAKLDTIGCYICDNERERISISYPRWSTLLRQEKELQRLKKQRLLMWLIVGINLGGIVANLLHWI